MARSFAQKMQELRRVVRLHANWLVYATLGESALSPVELEELTQYSRLPMGKELDLTRKSYLLGRLRATEKKSAFSAETYEGVSLRAYMDKLLPLEDMLIEHMNARAGDRLRAQANALGNKALSMVMEGMGSAISRAVAEGSADETVLALTHQELAMKATSLLAKKLEADDKGAWKTAVQAEMQAAKVAGSANAIANKVGIYANSDGPESLVSVIPGKRCCEDCSRLYLENGTPRVFKLSTLMAAPQNTVHKKSNGVHTHWHATLPPLHPTCGCQVVYVPPGYGWADGKLSLINKSLFEESLRKARNGVAGGISPTVEPKGAPANQKEPGFPSLAGAPSPTQTAGPGRPSGGLPKPGSGSGGAGGDPQFVPCPFGGGADCIKHGGNGAAMHKPNGSIMKKHTAAMANGAKPKTEQAQEAQRKQFDAESKAYNAESRPNAVVHDHLSEGDIGSMERLGDEHGGINASYKINIVGNGSGLMKPPIHFDGYLEDMYKDNPKKLAQIAKLSPEERARQVDSFAIPGAGTLPEGIHPRCEAAMSQAANALGLDKMYPETVVRTHDGSHDGPKGETSVQQWRDNAVSIGKYTGGGLKYSDLMKSVPPEHKEKVEKQFATIAVMDISGNNGDRHFGNIMMDKNTHDAIPIDHGTAFGTNLQGFKCVIVQQMHQSGVAIAIPSELHERMKNQTLSSKMRALDESGLPDHMKAQSYLRDQYAMHLQDEFGHLPLDRLRGTSLTRGGTVGPFMPDWEDVGGISKFFQLEEAKQLPNDRFEQFAKDWITTRANDPSHPQHEEGKKLMEMMPLRSSQLATGREAATPEALKKHFDSIGKYEITDGERSMIKRNMPERVVGGGGPAKPLREATTMPADKTKPAANPRKNKKPAPAPVESPATAKTEPAPTEYELNENDLEELDPKKNYGKEAHDKTDLSLDMSEFENKKKPASLDDEIDDAFEKIRVKKSLYLANPHAIFPGSKGKP